MFVWSSSAQRTSTCSFAMTAVHHFVYCVSGSRCCLCPAFPLKLSHKNGTHKCVSYKEQFQRAGNCFTASEEWRKDSCPSAKSFLYVPPFSCFFSYYSRVLFLPGEFYLLRFRNSWKLCFACLAQLLVSIYFSEISICSLSWNFSPLSSLYLCSNKDHCLTCNVLLQLVNVLKLREEPQQKKLRLSLARRTDHHWKESSKLVRRRHF